MARFPAVFALLLLPATASAEVRVQMQGGLLDVTARAPLSEILDRIARQTGMKVVYDGAPPRQVVAADLHRAVPSRAVIGLLEGQNLNFAATTDPSGQRVTTLMVLGSGARPGLSAPARPVPPSPLVSTGFDPSDAELNAEGVEGLEEIPVDEIAPEEEMAPEPEPEPEPEATPEELKALRGDAPPAMVLPSGGAWAQPQPQGQFGVFSPFPPAGAPAGAGAEAADEQPGEPQPEAE